MYNIYIYIYICIIYIYLYVYMYTCLCLQVSLLWFSIVLFFGLSLFSTDMPCIHYIDIYIYIYMYKHVYTHEFHLDLPMAPRCCGALGRLLRALRSASPAAGACAPRRSRHHRQRGTVAAARILAVSPVWSTNSVLLEMVICGVSSH